MTDKVLREKAGGEMSERARAMLDKMDALTLGDNESLAEFGDRTIAIIEAALAEERERTIEECARLAESAPFPYPETHAGLPASSVRLGIVAAIRSLDAAKEEKPND
jgi:hypothetical protein